MQQFVVKSKQGKCQNLLAAACTEELRLEEGEACSFPCSTSELGALCCRAKSKQLGEWSRVTERGICIKVVVYPHK